MFIRLFYFYQMEKKDIIILVVVGLVVVLRLYQKKMKKEQGTGGSKDAVGQSPRDSQDIDYEPYSGKKD